jgi:hypothetical protein
MARALKKGGYFSEQVPLTSGEEQPLFDGETNECIADWSNWSVKVYGQTMSFSPTREEYAQAGIIIDRGPGPGTLKEIELMRFLVHRLGEERLFMSDQVLLGHFPRCRNLARFLQTTQWQHPDVADGEKPSHNISIRSLVMALSQRDLSLFVQGRPKHSLEVLGPSRISARREIGFAGYRAVSKLRRKAALAAGDRVTHHPARALRCLAAPSETKEFTSRMTAFLIALG